MVYCFQENHKQIGNRFAHNENSQLCFNELTENINKYKYISAQYIHLYIQDHIQK